MKKYDALYIFAGTAKEDALDEQLSKALAEITRLGGVVETQTVLGKRTFAHPMHKRESGVYAEVRFQFDPLKVSELVNRYKLVEEVFRVQILAVDDRREALVVEQNARRKAKAEAEAAAAAEADADTAAPVEE